MIRECFDIHQHITDQIVAMLDQTSGDFELPWHKPDSEMLRPINVASGKAYRGVNVIALWASGFKQNYTSGLWGTYRQWTACGAQVRKGEKASYIVFYKDRGLEPNNAADNPEPSPESKPYSRLIAKASAVFAMEQVDGYEHPRPAPTEPVCLHAQSEAFIASTGATVFNDGHQAFYRPSTDSIHLPEMGSFIGTSTSTPHEAYYATLLHELTHWTGHKSRCDRDLGKRFGKAAYAMEELVAELGSAFVCARLQITASPRLDHAQYLAHWLNVMKSDKRAIFTAASKASEAVSFMEGLQKGATTQPCDDPPPKVLGDAHPDGVSQTALKYEPTEPQPAYQDY